MSLDLSDPDDRALLRTRLSGLYAGRPVLLGLGVLAGFTTAVQMLREAGSTRQLVVATGRGAGPVPDGVEVVQVEPYHAVSLTEELRTHDALLRHLPPDAVRRIEAFDPGREALWHATPFVTSDTPVLGRAVTLGRPAAFLALEDKLLAERLWETLGLDHAPSRVVPVELGALREATAALAATSPGGVGAVWSGDARDGFNGAGDYVRWVVTPDDARRAHAFFAPRCDLVRVLPFLDGVPCSVHGVVLPSGTAALRPVELAVLRDPRAHRFVYGGLSTCWSPPAADREAMRAVVRLVGDHLREAYGYRGVFGMDGVLTADGFRPTELNSRMSTGATTVLAGVDRHLLPLLQANLLAGVDVGLTAEEVESLLPAADRTPVARVVAVGDHSALRTPIRGAESFPVRLDGDRLARADAPTGSELVLSESASGFFAAIQPCALVPPGQRAADLNVALTGFLDAEYDAGFGPLVAAPSLR